MTQPADVAAVAAIEGPYDPEMKEAGQLTSPTWELELFLSGAFVFATFQLPGLIESAYGRLEPHVTDTSEFLLFNGVLYAKAIAFTLIAMFSVHLVMRSYWVALMGVQSVFPKGVRWENVSGGVVTKDVYRERSHPISDVIARLDNACTIVFSAGLLIVLLFAFSTVLLGVSTAVGYVLAQTIGHGKGTDGYFFVVLFLFMLVPAVARLLEKRLDANVDRTSTLYRVLHRVIGISYTVTLMRLIAPTMLTLSSNVGRKKSVAMLVIALFVIIQLAAIDRLVSNDVISTNTYDFFATSRNHGVDYRFYENQREAGKAYSRLPSIQSDVVRDPYLKLFIPYYPRRDNSVIARECPQLKPLQERGLQFGADDYVADSLTVPVLDCVARIHNVKLDGAVIPKLDLAFYEQQATGLKGFIAYIPIDSTAHGRHVLEVMPTPPATLPTSAEASRKATWKQPYVIPFWR